MFNVATVTAIILAYMGLLLLIALVVERKLGFGRHLTRNPVIYALALAVYCTSWTFYGSVGKAATSGMLFITVYLGATLAVLLWWVFLRRLVRIKHVFRINSIADFISARYGKSQALAALATAVALVGTAPYLALQLKSVFSTFAIISGVDAAAGPGSQVHVEWLLVVAMIAFTLVFGVRRLAPGERHAGMMAVLATQCVVKLVAFLAVGAFVTYGLFDGFGDIFARLEASEHRGLLDMGPLLSSDYILWCNYLILSMAAIQFLPRQFHVAVVENSDERHIRTAQWLLPLYLLLINLFVLPVAVAGLLEGLPVETADTYVLALPLAHDRPWLALLTFVGGFSAATGMVMISAMTLATMVSNHLVLPVASRVRGLAGLRRRVLPVRWFAVALVLLLGYLFEARLGDSHMLVNIGMISFAAALQFAPVILGGLFWRRGNRSGALAGLGSGFVLWGYTLLLPAVARSGWVPLDLLERGPWQLDWLRPEALGGLVGIDSLSHAVFWSLTVNVGLYVMISLLTRQRETEQTVAQEFVGILGPVAEPRETPAGEAFIDPVAKRRQLVAVLDQYLAPGLAETTATAALAAAGLSERTRLTAAELASLVDGVERSLAGVIGAAPARAAIRRGVAFSEREAQELSQVYAQVLSDMLDDPHDLRERIDYYAERQRLLARHARELEEKVRALDREIQERERAEHERNLLEAQMLHAQKLESLGILAGGIAHDFNNLLVAILGNADLAQTSPGLDDEAQRCLDEIVKASLRAADLCSQMLAYSGKGHFVIEPVDLSVVTVEMAQIVAVSISKKARLDYDIARDLPVIEADATQIRQVVMNLITNASEALGEEAGRITVRTGVIEVSADELAGAVNDGGGRPGRHVFLEVADDGCGMDAETRRRIFDPFFSTKFTGRGLGMAAVLGIVRGHRGIITVDSEEGRGTVFRVLLPVPAATVSGPSASGDEDVAAAAVQPVTGTVLVVDDEERVLNVCCQMLQQGGWETLTAADGREAVVTYRQHGEWITCVILDLVMPVMDGCEAAAALRDLDPDVRILLSSGYNEQEVSRRLAGWQPDGFVQKPYRARDLLQAVAAITGVGD